MRFAQKSRNGIWAANEDSGLSSNRPPHSPVRGLASSALCISIMSNSRNNRPEVKGVQCPGRSPRVLSGDPTCFNDIPATATGPHAVGTDHDNRRRVHDPKLGT